MALSTSAHLAFRLSRIQAEGWKAARALANAGDLAAPAIARRNPYRADPERARWLAGFMAALGAAA